MTIPSVIWPGRPYPLGATWDGAGVNFALYSAHATSVDLIVFDNVQALTTGEGIARWFGPYAAVTPGEGGSVSVGWDPKEMWETPITAWEPQRRMQTASEMPSKDGRMVRLAVDYYLEVQGGRVRVRLVHSGFDAGGMRDRVLRLGAARYLEKGGNIGEVRAAVREIIEERPGPRL